MLKNLNAYLLYQCLLSEDRFTKKEKQALVNQCFSEEFVLEKHFFLTTPIFEGTETSLIEELVLALSGSWQKNDDNLELFKSILMKYTRYPSPEIYEALHAAHQLALEEALSLDIYLPIKTAKEVVQVKLQGQVVRKGGLVLAGLELEELRLSIEKEKRKDSDLAGSESSSVSSEELAVLKSPKPRQRRLTRGDAVVREAMPKPESKAKKKYT